jgi:hypothetical protein
MNFWHKNFTRRKKESKEGSQRSDLTCGQYANPCKLGAN